MCMYMYIYMDTHAHIMVAPRSLEVAAKRLEALGRSLAEGTAIATPGRGAAQFCQ